MRTLSEEQSRFLEGTLAADAKGRPLVLHHGTPHSFDRFERTSDIGFHFGSREQATRRLKDLGRKERGTASRDQDRVVSVALRALNPLVLPDDPRAWNPGQVFSLLRRFTTAEDRRSIGQAVKRMESDVASREDLGKEIFSTLRRALLNAGHDTIVYRNQYESAVRSRGVDWSWVALDADAILTLPTDPGADALPWHDGVGRRPGISPDAVLAELGGLRRANGRIARSADRKAFRKAAVDRIGRSLGDLSLYRIEEIDWCQSWSARRHLDGRYVDIEVYPELGRLGLSIHALPTRGTDGQLDWSYNDKERVARLLEGDTFMEDLAPLAEFGGPTLKNDSWCPEFNFWRHWEPGERLSDVIEEFGRFLERTLEALPPLREDARLDSVAIP